MKPDLRFAPLNTESPGALASLLEIAYAPLLTSDPTLWDEERARWRQFDTAAFEHLETVGACVFLTWQGQHVAGFASYDPRQAPEVALVGHNGVLPEFQRRGVGTAQVQEVLRRLAMQGIQRARATTLDIPFFLPARRTYTRCGFTETRRTIWDRDPTKTIIEYETALSR